MKFTFRIMVFICSFLPSIYGQVEPHKSQPSPYQANKNCMNFSLLTNPTVKGAIEALQANNITAWYSYFTSNVAFRDDGRKLDFKAFFDNAFTKKEKFLSIDKVENDGKSIYGNFYAGQWGTFNVYFKFTTNNEGKITRLDIGRG